MVVLEQTAVCFWGELATAERGGVAFVLKNLGLGEQIPPVLVRVLNFQRFSGGVGNILVYPDARTCARHGLVFPSASRCSR
jgi:hypothetical protein